MQLARELPRRDVVAIIISLAGITVLSWFYLVKMATDMFMPEGMSPIQIPVWDAGRANRCFCFRVYRNLVYLQSVCNPLTMGPGSSRAFITNDGF